MDEDNKTNLVQSMEELMNLEEAPEITQELKEKHGIDLPAIQEERHENDVNEDMAYSRANLKKLIENSEGVVDTLSRLAQSAESPRMFEVLAQLMKVMVDANMGLMEIQKKGTQIKHLGPAGKNYNRKSNHEGGGDTYNTVYIGSTQALQKYLQDREKDEEKTHEDSRIVGEG